ncbi:RNA polymerase sigma factor [bacterium]|nr:RNA polymerase sigma factor [bacterium]
MDESRLIERFRSGDPEAFRQIVDIQYPQVYRLCFRFLGNREDAEEICQDVFIRLHRTGAGYRQEGKLFTFLYRIAVRLCLNRIRDRKRRNWTSLEHAAPVGSLVSDSPDRLLEQKEKEQAVRKAVDELPEAQRTALILRRYQELSYSEIAKVMQCSEASVESMLFRARQTLRKKLKSLLA